MKFLLIVLVLSSPTYTQDFSFLGLRFGMTQQEICENIAESKYLIMGEDTLLQQLIPPTPYTLVLKSNGSNDMIQSVFIDLNQETSYQITVFMNPLYFSFYTLSEKLLDIYGVPKSRTAQQVLWFDEDQQRRVSLEFPATIKYTDMPRYIEVLNQQKQTLESQQSESVDYKQRQLLLNEL